MSHTDTSGPRLSDAELAEMLGLVKQADSVELKLTVPPGDQRQAVTALDLDPLDAQIRQVFFLDTPNLDLDGGGIVVRARRVQGRQDDTVVKLRPVVPSDIPDKFRSEANFVVEVDAMPGGFVCSGSFKGNPRGVTVKDAVGGGKRLGKLFSKEQRAFFKTYAPEGIELDDLTVLGPIFVLKLKATPKDYERKLVAEMWLYPDGSRILELSTKCNTGEAFEVAAQTRAYLFERGLDLAGEQQTKTRTALEFFSTASG